MEGLDFRFLLYPGYDWQRSRTFVRGKAKKVRKRLLKIKQLLAEGQTPDDRVAAAADTLMQSVHLTLPESSAALDPDEFLHIMHDQLGDDDDDVLESRSSRPASASASRTRAAGQLERSSKPALTIELKAAQVELRLPISQDSLVSRLIVRAKSVNIHDHMQTSTWRTFLAELLPDNAYQPVDPDAKMLHLQLDMVKSASAGSAPEARLKVKLAPLRLHVDQDALDFLKVFFTFDASEKAQEVTDAGHAQEAFIRERLWSISSARAVLTPSF